MNTKLILPLLTSVGILICCSKGGTSKTQNTDDSVKNLTDKYFILQDAVSNPAFPVDNTHNSTDIYHDWYKDPCVLDDLRMYKSNGDLIYDNGVSKCDSSEPQVATLKWLLIENNTKIRTVQGTFIDTLKILINDGTTLKFEKKAKAVGSSDMYLWTETWHVQ